MSDPDEFDDATIYQKSMADDDKTALRAQSEAWPAVSSEYLDGTIYQGSGSHADNAAIDSDTVASPHLPAWVDDSTTISPTAVSPATRTASGETIPASTRHARIPRTPGVSMGNETFAPRSANGPERALRHDFNHPVQRRTKKQPVNAARPSRRNSTLFPWVVGAFLFAAAAIVVLVAVVL